MERFGGIWRQGLLVLRDFGAFLEVGWGIIGRFWGRKRACVCGQTSLCFRWNAEAFGSELFGVWGEMHLRLRGNVLAFWGVWVLRGIREVVCWIWMAVWVGVFSSWWSLMDCFGLPFWRLFFGLFWAVVLELLFCLLLVWVFVWLCFFLNFDKRFCLRILSGWAAGREKKVVLEREWGRWHFGRIYILVDGGKNMTKIFYGSISECIKNPHRHAFWYADEDWIFCLNQLSLSIIRPRNVSVYVWLMFRRIGW